MDTELFILRVVYYCLGSIRHLVGIIKGITSSKQ